MNGLYRPLFGVICGLALLCGFGAHAYAADSCLDEVLKDPTTVYANSENLALELTLSKGEDLGEISNEYLSAEKVLKKDFSYTLTSAQLGKLKDKSHKVTKEKGLEVQAKNGQKYQLPKEKTFKLESPPENYVAIIPAGKKLVRKGDSTPEKYALAEDLTVTVTPPKGIRVPLKLDAQTKIKRIPEPGTSSMGTTLTVEPKKAPPGGYIKLTVKKGEFDFGKARFSVCLRLHGKDAASKENFIPSEDVELQKAASGEAVLRVRIPEKIDGLCGWYLAKPVDLLVVALIPEEVQGKPVDPQRAEVMTQEFSISSRGLAIGIWILAFVLPWFFAAFVRYKRDAVEAAQTILSAAENKLKAAKKARDTANIEKLTQEVAKQREALENARERAKHRFKAYVAELNPVWMVSGKVGGASLSLAQILLWSILVFSASFYVLVVSGKLLDLTNDVLILLGITGGASIIAKITAAAKDEKGQALAGAGEKEPQWLDLIRSEGRPDLYKFQMALFTVLAAVFVTGKIYGTLEFPVLPAGLLTLIGISNGVYLSAKATSKSAFAELAEIDDKRQEATKNLEETKKKLEEAQKTKDKAKIDELTLKKNEQEEALKKLQKEFDDKKQQALR